MKIPRLRFILAFFLTFVPSSALCLPPPNPTQTLSSSKAWVLSSNGMNGGTVTALAVSPDFANDQTLLAGTSEGGVFKSTDGGAQWKAVNMGLGNTQIKALVYSPAYAADKTVFIGGLHLGIQKSANGGESWDWLGNVSWGHSYCLGISPHYAADSTFFGCINDVGIYRTTNGGSTWDLLKTNLANR